MNLLFLKAMYHVIGREHLEKVVLHFAVGDGFYYTVHGDVTIDNELIGKVKQYMHSLVEKEIPLMKRDVNTQEAISLFHQYGHDTGIHRRGGALRRSLHQLMGQTIPLKIYCLHNKSAV